VYRMHVEPIIRVGPDGVSGLLHEAKVAKVPTS
jgi:hypothetical protein